MTNTTYINNYIGKLAVVKFSTSLYLIKVKSIQFDSEAVLLAYEAYAPREGGWIEILRPLSLEEYLECLIDDGGLLEVLYGV